MTESFKFPVGEQEKLPESAEVLLKAGEAHKYISTLEGAISSHASAFAQVVVSKYSEQELALQILQSDENDWQQKPAFFKELCDAYYLKIKAKRGI